MNQLPELLTQQLYLIAAQRGSDTALTSLVARLALQGGVQVLDGGNRLRPYLCGRELARLLYSARPPDAASLPQALERIQVARAFTCYQVVSLLSQAPARPFPTLVLDLLSTFYDESVSMPEARRLLASCISQLLRLSAYAPVVVSVGPLPAKAPQERAVFLKVVEAAAQAVWVLQDPTSPPSSRQSRLPDL